MLVHTLASKAAMLVVSMAFVWVGSKVVGTAEMMASLSDNSMDLMVDLLVMWSAVWKAS